VLRTARCCDSGRVTHEPDHGPPADDALPDAGRPDPLSQARADVLRDLAACAVDTPAAIDRLEDAVTARRWWVHQWPGGAEHVAGQVAQDVQERLLDDGLARWPVCASPQCGISEPHELRIDPELGPAPHWVCEASGVDVARLGQLRHVQRGHRRPQS